jgi:hypothetical protein
MREDSTLRPRLSARSPEAEASALGIRRTPLLRALGEAIFNTDEEPPTQLATRIAEHLTKPALK